MSDASALLILILRAPCPSDIEPSDIGPSEADIGAADIGPSDVGPSDIDASFASPRTGTYIWQTSCGPQIHSTCADLRFTDLITLSLAAFSLRLQVLR